MSYFRRLAQREARGSLIQDTGSRIVLLTGQSSFSSARLSPEQETFLRMVAPVGCEPLLAGFPYHANFLGADFRSAGMVAASVRNGVQVMGSLLHPSYRLVLEGVLQELVDKTRELLVLVTGSCGLQMANAVWPRLQLPVGLRVEVVALGPACAGVLRLQGARVTVVQGDQDGWSHLFYRGNVDVRCSSGHLDYWTSLEVQDCVAKHLAGGA